MTTLQVGDYYSRFTGQSLRPRPGAADPSPSIWTWVCLQRTYSCHLSTLPLSNRSVAGQAGAKDTSGAIHRAVERTNTQLPLFRQEFFVPAVFRGSARTGVHLLGKAAHAILILNPCPQAQWWTSLLYISKIKLTESFSAWPELWAQPQRPWLC